ncbi:Putative NACHT nucleoside triphosphatase, heterokaryon incompatibility [Septoria linicola]|uniref:NACHT nucleoside triphosphatase, heterokaryon incompatibility n=1 Tax=Septoria linicola TaxID=215465 RepID=A0A9Q9AT51_9PEZI|nr:putative NACHT nucleoside triphosphatase, heterokaryon incompatibility [Septoria linicola]USW50276.1 Putative NACHT nucleoside triphosphatase, heterokaryon incompatibility [Septoria linicola]
MRLLNVHTLELEDFLHDVPHYVVASHRWALGDEATTQDVKNKRNMHKSGYQKVAGFARYVRERIDNIDWIWIDTCCVNQDSSQEVTEAVNSMFRWYTEAELCIAYLIDVVNADDKSEFRNSNWFQRGWTLQELLAPSLVIFVSQRWELIGHKGKHGWRIWDGDCVSLEPDIASITKIPEPVLRNYDDCKGLTTEEKLAWIGARETTREEDLSYCLLGIFNVAMPVIYGEGADSARQRLLRKIFKFSQQRDQFNRKVVNWFSPPDPWVNHASARRRHEDQTGAWLLDSKHYQHWKSSSSGHIWLYGKPGCGKTVLCSTVIEDIRPRYESSTNVGLGIYYFSFSDSQKQSYENLLFSLVVQLGWKEPAQSTLFQLYDKPNRSIPHAEVLETILTSAIKQFDEVFLLLDALDECAEDNEERRNLLDFLDRLAQANSNLKIFATSRLSMDIKASMEVLGAAPFHVDVHAVNADIRDYVKNELSRDRKLNGLDDRMKAMIRDTLAQKAEGMFRWAICQLQELKKLKSTKPKRLSEALTTLPRTLDETYERMLVRIEEMDRTDALTALRWLAFSHRPLTLGELVDASVTDPSGEGEVDSDNRGGVEDVLAMLSDLIIVDGDNERANTGKRTSSGHSSDAPGHDSLTARTYDDVSGTTRVRLAHFSVKEYLVSERILHSNAQYFHLRESREHHYIAQSCLSYGLHYSTSAERTGTPRDFTIFPLLEYAAQYWSYHSSLQDPVEIDRESRLLASDKLRREWLLVHQPDLKRARPFEDVEDIGCALYYAVYLKLDAVVHKLLSNGANVNAQGGFYGNALQAAAGEGHLETAKMLVKKGADINAQGGFYGNALRAALLVDHKTLAEMLIQSGADLSDLGSEGDYVLHAASSQDYENLATLLIYRRSGQSTPRSITNNVLQAASRAGHEKLVEMLLDKGADVNARGGYYGSALQAAAGEGHKGVAAMLIDRGADVNAGGGFFGNSLKAALREGHTELAEMLVDKGADVDLVQA